RAKHDRSDAEGGGAHLRVHRLEAALEGVASAKLDARRGERRPHDGDGLGLGDEPDPKRTLPAHRRDRTCEPAEDVAVVERREVRAEDRAHRVALDAHEHATIAAERERTTDVVAARHGSPERPRREASELAPGDGPEPENLPAVELDSTVAEGHCPRGQ